MPTLPKRAPLAKRPHFAPANPRAARSLPFSVPGEHFQLVPAGALLCVARVSPEQAGLEPQATFTRRELSVLLYEQDIPTVQGAALAGFLSSLQALPRFESHAPRRVVGAIWGTEVPVVGNIVGSIIGFGGYYIFDSLTGEQIEQGGRQGLEGPTSGGR